MRELIKRAPGLLIERVKVVRADWEHNRIVAAVKPWSEKKCPQLSAGYRKNITKFMDKKRILGTDLQIAEPEYIQIRVYADLELVAWYRDTEQVLKERSAGILKNFVRTLGVRCYTADFTDFSMDCRESEESGRLQSMRPDRGFSGM
ncbi:MAG: hypothetical protein ACLUAR_10370 [Pilosibacter sp.]